MVVDGIAAGIRCAIRPIIAQRTGVRPGVRKRLLPTRFDACSDGLTSTAGRALPTSPQVVSATTPQAAAAPPVTSPLVSNPMISISLDWNGSGHGMDWHPLLSCALHTNGWQSTAQRGGQRVGENDKRVRGRFHYDAGNDTETTEGENMPSYVACGAELELPVRVPHTVYVKILYRIAGQDYCRHAEIENAIRDLKYGVGLNHLPSGRFAANAAWLAVQVMAHNLARWTARIGLGEPVVTTKTLRRRFFSLTGRLTRSARRLTLRLPRHWPRETQFSGALARLRALPFPA